MEDLVRRVRLVRPHAQYSFWLTATGQEVDLEMDFGGDLLTFDNKVNTRTNPHDVRRLESMLYDIGASQGFLTGIDPLSTTCRKCLECLPSISTSTVLLVKAQILHFFLIVIANSPS